MHPLTFLISCDPPPPLLKDFENQWGNGALFHASFFGILRVRTSGNYDFELESKNEGKIKIWSSTGGWTVVVNRQCCWKDKTNTNDPTTTGAEVNLASSWTDSTGNTNSGEKKYLDKDQEYKIEVHYRKQEGAAAYLKVKWKLDSESEFHFIEGSTNHGVSTPSYSSTRGGGLFVSPTSIVNIIGPASFEQNIVEGGDGGGIYFTKNKGSTLQHGANADASKRVIFKQNTAKKKVYRTDTIDQLDIGGGRGGGLFADESQINTNPFPMSVVFENNVPSGIHSLSSSIFLAAPMNQIADAIISGDGDFPFPIPKCSKGEFFRLNDLDPW